MRHIQLYSLIDRRQRRKLAVVQSVRRRLARAGLGCGAFLLLVLVGAILAASLFYASLVDNLPSLSLLPELLDPERGMLMQPTRVYDRSGQELLFSLENPGIARRYLYIDASRADHFSPELIRVTVGALEPGFWQGSGFSLRDLTSQQPVTIAERLVDDVLLWNEPAGLRRALRMRVLATQVVARYGHTQVLEWYLNSTYYGHLAFSADSAARLYLDKPASQLDLAEAALIVAASQTPALNPQDAPAAALEMQQVLLDELLRRGVIPAEERRRAGSEKMRLAGPVAHASLLAQAASPAAAFARLALDGLAERFDAQRSERSGRDQLERGGLRVITTLDYSLQLELSCLAHTQLARLVGQPDETSLPDGKPCQSARLLPSPPPGDAPLPKNTTASAVVLDPRTGQVLALLGDTTLDGETSSFSPREPGSLLTPFVALTAFARGLGPASLTWDIPASLSTGADSSTANSAGAASDNAAAADLQATRPNPDGKYHGPVRLRMAIDNDYLAAQAQLLAQIGPASVWQLASALGLSSLAEESGADLLYHDGQVSPLELAQAYGVFASLGARTGQRIAPGGDLRPAMVLYVEDARGTPVLDARSPETQTVVTSQLAYLVHHVLSDETARWPSLGYPNALEIGRPAGAKIGQVEGDRQVWAAGYTPQRVAVFSLTLPDSGGAGGPTGSSTPLAPRMAAGMWHALMQYASRNQPAGDWPEPPGITHLEVCDPSGLLPTETCPKIASEVFLNGAEPTGPDTLYQSFQVNIETGRLATVFTPPMLVEEKVFIVVPPQARAWAQLANLPLPPQEYDAIQPPEPSANVRITSPGLYAFVHGKVTLKGTAGGDGFRSYQVQVGQGVNPQTWLQVGQDGTTPVKDGVLGVWDTQGQEGLYSVRLQVVHADLTAETAAIQVTVDNTPPLAHIPYPINGQEFQAAQDKVITFQAEVSDAIGVRRIVWLVDGVQVGETVNPPYAFAWKAARGEHVLQVKAYDLAGNEGQSEQVRFSVK